jgi:uncharacterized protein
LSNGGGTLKFEYTYPFRLPSKIVWKYIKDENILKNSIPGCKSFVENSGGIYHAEVEFKLGPIKDVFTLEVRRVQEKSPSFYRLKIKGKGNLGEFDAQAEVLLKDLQGGSKLLISADAQLTGALAVAAQRVLDSGANEGLENFFQRIEKEIKRSLYKMRKEDR